MSRLISFITSCLLFACIGVSAFADDLDIYLGSSANSVTYNPNVLFIMDTSGSMTSTDNTGQSRMLRVQNALKDALGSATNINAGLMRFSDYGGPILYPIQGIDDAVRPELVTSTGASNHDGYEINGNVDISDDELVLSSGTDTVLTGLRFSDMNIPQGATIVSAYLRFTSEKFNVAGTQFIIKGEADTNSAEFSTATSNLSTRTQTSAQVQWDTDNDFPASGEIVTSPDISSVIEEIVGLSSWCGGQDLSLFVEGTSSDAASHRLARAFDSGQGGAPQLVVVYDDSTATGCIGGEAVYQVSSSRR